MEKLKSVINGKAMLTIAFAVIQYSAISQSTSAFNFGFEIHSVSSELADGWFQWADYTPSIDTTEFYSGSRSGKITSSKSKGTFGCIVYQIPALEDIQGDSIRLEGYMRLQEVENGFAGLLLRVDVDGKAHAFDNMNNQYISGTRDWAKYSITLKYPEGADMIYVAGILAGMGEAWFDDFKLTIDGKTISPKIKN